MSNEVRDAIKFLKGMSKDELETHKNKMHRRQIRIQTVEEAKRWKIVLSWKNRV